MLCAVSCFAPRASYSASIELDLDDLFSSKDFAEALKPENRLTALDQERYKPLQAKNLVQLMPVTLSSGDTFDAMLLCGDVSDGGVMRNVQLLLVDDRRDTPRVVQRIKLGDGEEPYISTPNNIAEPQDMMIRIIRSGNNAECYVYDINRTSGKLTEAFRINRGTPERRKVDIKAVMHAEGRIEIMSKTPPQEETLDMSGALNALIEDEIYQENGRPVPAIVNLKCTRAGWEDDRIYERDGAIMLDMGLSLVTLSKKTVVEVALTYKKDGGNKWVPHAVACTPFLPYR